MVSLAKKLSNIREFLPFNMDVSVSHNGRGLRLTIERHGRTYTPTLVFEKHIDKIPLNEIIKMIMYRLTVQLDCYGENYINEDMRGHGKRGKR